MTKAWLRDKLTEGNGTRDLWHEPETTRFSFRRFEARLIDHNGKHNTPDNLAEANAHTRAELSASLIVDLYSVRVRARDLKRKGKLVETWLRGSMLKRLIVRARPSREGLDHNRYSIAAAFLIYHGLCEPDPCGRNGYVWTEAYRHLRDRAEWLEQLMRGQGEFRTVRAETRFEMTDR